MRGHQHGRRRGTPVTKWESVPSPGANGGAWPVDAALSRADGAPSTSSTLVLIHRPMTPDVLPDVVPLRQAASTPRLHAVVARTGRGGLCGVE